MDPVALKVLDRVPLPTDFATFLAGSIARSGLGMYGRMTSPLLTAFHKGTMCLRSVPS
jgi:hypothetical protein